MSFIPNDYLINVARGNVTGAQPFAAYGEHTSGGAASGVLWLGSSFAFPPAAGLQLTLSSSSASDTAAGTGAREVYLQYLDASLAQKTETVTLSGTVGVTTVATDIRFVQNMFVASVGSGGAAAGNVSASSGGTTYALISAAHLNSRSSVRMVPAGKKLFVSSFYGGAVSGSSGAQAEVSLASPNINGVSLLTSNLFYAMASASYQDGSGGLSVACPLMFTEGQALGMTFSVDKAAAIVGSWFGWMENA